MNYDEFGYACRRLENCPVVGRYRSGGRWIEFDGWLEKLEEQLHNGGGSTTWVTVRVQLPWRTCERGHRTFEMTGAVSLAGEYGNRSSWSDGSGIYWRVKVSGAEPPSQLDEVLE